MQKSIRKYNKRQKEKITLSFVNSNWVNFADS